MTVLNNVVLAGAMAKCNHSFAVAAAAFDQLGAVPDNLAALDAKYRLAQSVMPADPLSVMPEADRREYMLLVAQQMSLSAMRGMFGVVNALVRERDSYTSGPSLADAIDKAIAKAVADTTSQANTQPVGGNRGGGEVTP